jgi:hypothetical protein
VVRLPGSSIVLILLLIAYDVASVVAQSNGARRPVPPASTDSSERVRPAPVEPAIEAIDVEGAERTHPGVVLDAVGLRPKHLLTRDAFERAARKLDALPAASSTALTEQPTRDGGVRLKASIEEKALMPKALQDWALVGGRALFVGDVKIDIAGPFGAGEVFSTSFRWAENRPRVAFDVSVPGLGPLPGVTRFEASWDRQAYAFVAADDTFPFRQTRERAGFGVSDWATNWLAWRAGTAFDRFDDRDTVAVNAGIDTRFLNDLLAILLGVEAWSPTSGGRGFMQGDLLASWRSNREASAPWMAVAGTTIASDASPLALWPGASAGRGRGVLLRAHPLHESGIVTSDVFGRRMVYTSVERLFMLKTMKIATISAAGFVDTAKAWRRADGLDASPFHVDIGGGLRVNSPKTGGMIRIDFGYGLRDGEKQLSAGWVGRWPRRY